MTPLAEPRRCRGAAPAVLLCVVVSAALAATAAAADNQPPPAPGAPASAPAVAPQSPPAQGAGFLHQLKVWWDESIGFFDVKVKTARGTLGDLDKQSNAAAKGAAATAQAAMNSAVAATRGAAATAQDAMRTAVEATKGAATVIARLPNTRVVTVHEPCPAAPNGAPDCAAGANNACRAKGFNGGQPLDVRTAEKCDAAAAVQAEQGADKGPCPLETWIARAVCQ